MMFKKNPGFSIYPRSAELHSAVSRISNAPGAGRFRCDGRPIRPAECNSAIQQSATLRYLSLALLLLTLGCRTVAPLPPADFSEPGWTLKQGQAVWRVNHEAPEIAGDLLLATHTSGRTLVQFTKTPFPLMIAQTTTNSWQIESPAQNRFYSGRGHPPQRVVWFHLPRAAVGAPLEGMWSATKSNEHWRIENRQTGEFLEGYFAQ